MRQTISLTIISFFFSGCVYTNIPIGPMSGPIVNPENKIYQNIGTLSGEASASYCLFISGNEQNLAAAAKENLIQSAASVLNATMRNGKVQFVLSNVTTDLVTVGFLFPLYFKKQLHITADVFAIGVQPESPASAQPTPSAISEKETEPEVVSKPIEASLNMVVVEGAFLLEDYNNSASQIVLLKEGDKLTVITDKGGFWKVKFNNNIGWVRKKYVRFE